MRDVSSARSHIKKHGQDIVADIQGNRVTAPLDPPQGIYLYSVDLTNHLGDAVGVGVGARYGKEECKVEFFDDSASLTVDVSHLLDASNSTVESVLAEDADHLIVSASRKFNSLTFRIDSEPVAGGSVVVLTYWNGASWSPLTPILAVDTTVASGYASVLFEMPNDWAKSSDGFFKLRVAVDTTQADPLELVNLYVNRIMDYTPTLASGATVSLWVGVRDDSKKLLPGDSVIFYTTDGDDVTLEHDLLVGNVSYFSGF